MKRILLIIIPIYIGIIIGIISLGKILFGKYEYHIPKEQTFEIWQSTARNTNERILKVYEEGELINEVPITTLQISKIYKSRVVITRRYRMWYGRWWIFLYIAFIISSIIFFCAQISDLNCYFSGTGEDYGYCKKCSNKKCISRFKCKSYMKIEEYDLTPHKKKFKLFWGYN